MYTQCGAYINRLCVQQQVILLLLRYLTALHLLLSVLYYYISIVHTADTTKPVIAPVATIMLEASGPAGAVASFNPAVADAVTTGIVATCTCAGGLISSNTFPIGTTACTCNAADAAGNAATPVTFAVTVGEYYFSLCCPS
jgi:HYR domain